MGTELLLSLIFSTFGAGYFIYGKKQAELFFMLSGAILCIYPYFVSNAMPMLFTGLLLMAVPFTARYFDWSDF